MKKIVTYWIKNDDDFEIPKENIIHIERILTDDGNGRKTPTIEVWVLEEKT